MGRGGGARGASGAVAAALGKEQLRVAPQGVQHIGNEGTRRVLYATVATRQQESDGAENLASVVREGALVRGLSAEACEELEAFTL